MQPVSEVVERAKASSEFRDFEKQFASLGVASARGLDRVPVAYLAADEMPLFYGLGAFFEGNGINVEIGTYEGASALFTAAGLRHRGRGCLYSIDPHFGAPPFVGIADEHFTLARFRGSVEKCGLTGLVRSIVSDSGAAAAVWPGHQIDALYIDGDHSYLGAIKDFESWVPKVRAGGMILIDDADDPALPEMRLFFDDILSLNHVAAEGTVGGVAILRREASDPFAMLDDIRNIVAERGVRRPWNLEFVHRMKPIEAYRPSAKVTGDPALDLAFQFGFFARCEPGDYGITAEAAEADCAFVSALASAHGDGVVTMLDLKKPKPSICRLVIGSIDSAAALAKHLKPGGVMIGRSALEPSYQNANPGAP